MLCTDLSNVQSLNIKELENMRKENELLRRTCSRLEAQNGAQQREIERLVIELTRSTDLYLDDRSRSRDGRPTLQDAIRSSSLTSTHSYPIKTLSSDANEGPVRGDMQSLHKKASSSRDAVARRSSNEFLREECARVRMYAIENEKRLLEARREAEMNFLDKKDTEKMVDLLEKTVIEFRNSSSGVNKRMDQLVQTEKACEKLVQKTERLVEALPPHEEGPVLSSGSESEEGPRSPRLGGALHESLFNVNAEAIEWERRTPRWSPKRLARGVKRNVEELKESIWGKGKSRTIKMCVLREIEEVRKTVENDFSMIKTVERLRREVEQHRTTLQEAESRASGLERKLVEEQYKLRKALASQRREY